MARTGIDEASVAEARRLVPAAFGLSLREKLARTVVWGGIGLLTAWCFYAFDFAPGRILEGITRLGRIAGFMFPPHIWQTWLEWSEILQGLGETVAMAFMGTLLGAIFAFPLSFIGAKNIKPFNWFRLTTRRGFDTLRAVEQIILALIFIRAFGLGPLAGVLAIAVSEIGTFSKLFSEAIENTSDKPVDGVKESGAAPFRPSVLPRCRRRYP